MPANDWSEWKPNLGAPPTTNPLDSSVLDYILRSITGDDTSTLISALFPIAGLGLIILTSTYFFSGWRRRRNQDTPTSAVFYSNGFGTNTKGRISFQQVHYGQGDTPGGGGGGVTFQIPPESNLSVLFHPPQNGVTQFNVVDWENKRLMYYSQHLQDQEERLMIEAPSASLPLKTLFHRPEKSDRPLKRSISPIRIRRSSDPPDPPPPRRRSSFQLYPNKGQNEVPTVTDLVPLLRKVRVQQPLPQYKDHSATNPPHSSWKRSFSKPTPPEEKYPRSRFTKTTPSMYADPYTSPVFKTALSPSRGPLLNLNKSSSIPSLTPPTPSFTNMGYPHHYQQQHSTKPKPPKKMGGMY